MTRMQRVSSFITGLMMIAGAVLFELDPVDALPVIVMIMTVSLMVYGIRMLVYYITLARHMVGGLSILYRAMIILDLAAFSMTLTKMPLLYVMLYLASIHAFSGAVDIMRALEARNLGSRSWKLNMLQGILGVAASILCLVFIKSTRTVVSIYSAGVLYSGLIRIIQAIRNTDVMGQF